MDYFFVTKESVRRRDGLAKELAEVMESHGAPASELLRKGHGIAENAGSAGAANPTEHDSVGGAGEEAITNARTAGTVVKCALIRCFHSKNVFAHVVPQKGDDEDHYCAKLAVDDIGLAITKLLSRRTMNALWLL